MYVVSRVEAVPFLYDLSISAANVRYMYPFPLSISVTETARLTIPFINRHKGVRPECSSPPSQ